MIMWNQKTGEKSKLRYRDTDSFIVYIKTEGIYINISKDVETRFDNSDYELETPLHSRTYILC